MKATLKEVFGRWVISLLLIILASSSYAIVLDWSNVSWPDGSLSRNFNVDSSNPGSDVNITITGNTSRFFDDYPQITDDFTGGLGSGTDQLDLFVNFSDLNEAITVTITFNYADGVDNVNFTLFDIDTANSSTYPRGFIDQIRNISARAMDGTSVIPTITSSANNTVLGGGTSSQVVQGVSVTSDTGSGSGDANANFDFGDNAIKSFTFTYGNAATGVVSNPAQQGVGLYDITYGKAKPRIPEFHPEAAAIVVCLSYVILKQVLGW